MTQTPLIPPNFAPLILEAWLNTSDRAAGAIASFRQQVMIWQQEAEIDNNALLYELQRLDDSGLSSYVIRILADAAIVLILPDDKLPPRLVGGVK